MPHDFSIQPEGAEALHKLQPRFNKTDLVESSTRLAERHGARSGNAAMKIGKLLTRLEDISDIDADDDADPAEEHRKNEVFDRLIGRYEANLLTQYEDIPKSYWALRAQMARDNGEDDRLSDDRKREIAEQIQDAQLTGLRTWTEYLEENEYPMWFTVYALEGMSTLATFNKEKGIYNRRSNATVTPYPELNVGPLHKTYDAVVTRYITRDIIYSDQVRALTDQGNFNKLYSHFMLENNAMVPTPERAEDVRGEWRTFTRESIDQVIEAAQGTPWCIAGRVTAEDYLDKPDSSFSMFFLQDEASGNYSKTASAAIRMDRGAIVELSGLKGGSKQFIEDALVPTISDKLRDMPGGERFLRALDDKQTLIMMDRKFKAGEEFTLDELTFLYEFDRLIEHVNNLRGSDPRIDEFKQDFEHHLIQMAGHVNTFALVELVSEKGNDYLLNRMKLLLDAASDPDAIADGLYEHQTNPPTSAELNQFLSQLGDGDVVSSTNVIKFIGDGADVHALVPHIESVVINRASAMLLENGAAPELIAQYADWGNDTSVSVLRQLLDAGVDPDLLVESIGRDRELGVADLDVFEAAGELPDMRTVVWSLNSEVLHTRYAFLIAAGVPTDILDDRLEMAGIENDRS